MTQRSEQYYDYLVRQLHHNMSHYRGEKRLLLFQVHTKGKLFTSMINRTTTSLRLGTDSFEDEMVSKLREIPDFPYFLNILQRLRLFGFKVGNATKRRFSLLDKEVMHFPVKWEHVFTAEMFFR